MKRFAVIALALVLGCAVLTGCRRQNTTEATTPTTHATQPTTHATTVPTTTPTMEPTVPMTTDATQSATEGSARRYTEPTTRARVEDPGMR